MNESVSQATTSASTLAALGASLIALLLVVGLILLLAWLLRRLPGAAWRGNPDLRLVAQLAVGVRERVVVIAVGEHQYLLGVTSENVRLLDRLETPLADPPKLDFRQLLQRSEPRP